MTDTVEFTCRWILSPLRFTWRRANGVTLHVAEAGPEDGPVVLLLHGFPEFWFGWRHQIDDLVAAGYRVIIPDQRGYNLSDRPASIDAYALDHLAQDIVALADDLGERRLTVVGHDWGASVAWWLATRHPERIARFVAMAAPHPAVWLDAIRNLPEQRRKSRYVQFLRLPWLPEVMLQSRDFQALVDAIKSGTSVLADDEIDFYRAAWSRRGALRGMINWYRALLRSSLDPARQGSIAAPGLVLWGDRDHYGIPELAERSAALCNHAEVIHLDATHWLHHDMPGHISSALIGFLRS